MSEARLFSALLKHHRRLRGHSQLDLAASAEISARHLSFLETGRARPSREMVLRLGETLGLALRDINTLVVAAGYSETFEETAFAALDPALRGALERMMRAQEPYPLMVFDGRYDIQLLNGAAERLLRLALPQGPDGPDVRGKNLLTLCFDPKGMRPHIESWESVARHLLQRVAREHLMTGRESLGQLLSQLLAYPDVPSDFRSIDLGARCEPVLELSFRAGDARLRFLTTLTSFNAPQNVTLEELRIESYFPLDDATVRVCEQLATADV